MSQREVDTATPVESTFDALKDISHAIHAAADFSVAAQLGLYKLCELTGLAVGHAWVRQSGQLVSSGVWYLHDRDRYAVLQTSTEFARIEGDDGLVSQAIVTHQPRHSFELGKSTESRMKLAHALGLSSAFVFPVMYGGRTVAALEFFGTRLDALGERTLEVVDQACLILGAAVERDRLAREARSLAEQKELILEATPVGICGLDDRGHVTFINSAGANMLRFSREEMKGRSQHELFHHSNSDGSASDWVDSPVFEVLATTQPRTCPEDTFWCKDGAALPVSYSVTPLRRSGGKGGALLVFGDASEERLAAFEHSEAKDAATAALQSKGAFLATMSHEIRTPLSAVLGMTEILRDTKLNAEQADCADTIHSSALGLLQMMEDVLDFARIEANDLQVRDEPMDVASVVEQAVTLIRPRARAKNIRLTVNISPAAPTRIVADADRIQKVLVNLLSNAVKFTNEGHVGLTVAVPLTPRGPNATTLRFEVLDTGMGIDPADQGKLFRQFTQLDGSAAREHGGSGLGLAISRRLVELMGGRIGVDSNLGVGSAFWFELDVRDTAEATDPADTPVQSVEPRRHRILVAEDNGINQQVIRRVIEKMGHDVLVVDDGQEAIEALERETYDVVFMDCAMPVLDGYTATERIRESKTGFANVPIVALTAHAMEGDRERCLEAGMNDYLSKPVRAEEIDAVLEKWLEGAAVEA